MKYFAGVDVGTSTDKVVIINEKNERLSAIQNESSEKTIQEQLLGAVEEAGIKIEDLEAIAVTGTGVSKAKDNVLGIPVKKVMEFDAIGRSGQILSGIDKIMVVSIGTGTAYVMADGRNYRHAGGSGVGGGTINGMARRMFELSGARELADLAVDGKAEKTDLQIKDICDEKTTSLPSYVTVSNMGKTDGKTDKCDLAAGVLNMVYQTAGLLAVFGCANTDVRNVVVTGSAATLPRAEEFLNDVGMLCGYNFIIPKEARFATAIGAAGYINNSLL